MQALRSVIIIPESSSLPPPPKPELKDGEKKVEAVRKEVHEKSRYDSRDDRGREKTRTVRSEGEHVKRERSSDKDREVYAEKKSRRDDRDDRPRFETHHLPMKGTIYLENIKKGVKTHEGRVCRGTCAKMRVGDHLVLKDKSAQKGIECEIISCDKYYSFKEMLQAKGVLNMLPQLAEYAKRATSEKLLEEGVRVYEGFPGSHDVKKLGCVAIGVKFLKDC